MPKQIEYGSQIGRIAAENPDLPFSVISDILIANQQEPVVEHHFARAIQKLHKQQNVLAYRVLDENTLKWRMEGPHENFYRYLKDTGHGHGWQVKIDLL